jgi:hypothetical protein
MPIASWLPLTLSRQLLGAKIVSRSDRASQSFIEWTEQTCLGSLLLDRDFPSELLESISTVASSFLTLGQVECYWRKIESTEQVARSPMLKVVFSFLRDCDASLSLSFVRSLHALHGDLLYCTFI